MMTRNQAPQAAFKMELKHCIEANPLAVNQRIEMNVDQIDYSGYPILLAAQMNNTDAVLLLLNNSVDTSVQDELGRTAIDYARHHNNQRLIRAITDYENQRNAKIETETNAILLNIVSGQALPFVDPLFNEVYRNTVIHKLSLLFKDNIAQYQTICDAIKTPGTTYDLSLILPASHNILRGNNNSSTKDNITFFSSLLTDVLLEKSQTNNPEIRAHCDFILMHSINHTDPNTCQFKAGDHLFNLMQTMLLLYNNDEHDLPCIQALCKKNDQLLNFNTWQNHYNTGLFVYEAMGNNHPSSLKFLNAHVVTHQNNQTTRNDNASPKSTIDACATADNALRLVLRSGVFTNRLALIRLLAKRSALVHLAEVLIEFAGSMASINTRITFAVSSDKSMPAFFSNKASADIDNDQNSSQLEMACNNGSLKCSNRIRPLFVFYANTSTTEATEKETVLAQLLKVFISRCNAIQQDKTSSTAMEILTDRGDEFHAKQQYESAAASYNAALLFYSLIAASKIDDHIKLLDVFERHACSIAKTSHPQCTAIAASDRTLADHFCYYLYRYGSTPDEQAALQTTKAFSRIKKNKEPPVSQTPAPLAAQSNKNGSDTALQFRQAASEGRINQVIALASRYPTLIDEQGSITGKTALHQAIIRKQYTVVQYLIHEQHARTDIQDNTGKSALDYIHDSNDERLNAMISQQHTRPSRSR